MKAINETIEHLRARLSSVEWERRCLEADQLAEVAARIEGARAAGLPERAAIRQEAPGVPETTWVKRLRLYRRAGRDGLVSRRVITPRARKLTDEVRGMVKGILHENPTLYSPEVRLRLAAMGVEISETVTKRAMKQVGLAKARGTPHRGPAITPLALAGAELLLAMDVEDGATAALVADLERHFKTIPAPTLPVVDDRAHRDGLGRFEGGYNAAQEREEGAAIGPKFDSTPARSQVRDLQALRTTTSSTASLHRKVLAMVLLPVVTDSPRWSALEHWQGALLDDLVGVPYQPATLDKFARELKHAGASVAAKSSVALHWLQTGTGVPDAPTGMALVYADITVKPLWTHAFSRSAKVAKLGGRVMPATSSLFLHTGTGTPVLFQSWSGTASMPKQIERLLDEYEEAAGVGTVRRLVVMDREAHAAWLLKALDGRERRWDYIVPLRKSVVGLRAKFRDVTPWVPYGDNGDEVCGGYLLLRDSRKPAAPLEVRVVGRRRHRTQNISWYATMVEPEAIPDAEVLRLYFARWPLQEHVFRNAAGRVHLDSQYGYGKSENANVAVLDRLEKMDAKARQVMAKIEGLLQLHNERAAEQSRCKKAIRQTELRRSALHREMDALMATGGGGSPKFNEAWQTVRALDNWLAPQRVAAEAAAQLAAKDQLQLAKLRDQVERIAAERPKLARHQTICTVDVELDQIMTAFKLTFLNLCNKLMACYFGGRTMQIDTLIRAVLTLPGERERTRTDETIRIWRQPRDRKVMPLVEEACRLLTARGLVRHGRRLHYEVVDPPAMTAGHRRADATAGSFK